MKVYDFEYDGIKLSDLGYTICSFDYSGNETIVGSKITFNTVAVRQGTLFELTSAKYDSVLESTFYICKSICKHEEIDISVDEFRKLNRWLNRKKFLKFKLLCDEYLNIFFEGSFNISKIEIGGVLVGLQLDLTTNRPFALLEPRVHIINVEENNFKYIIFNASDDEGIVYPNIEIKIKDNGNLIIYNSMEENRKMIINNCKVGEVINIDYPIITTNYSSHDISNDFNWTFIRLANTFRDNKNELSISIPCDIKLTYLPSCKVTL